MFDFNDFEDPIKTFVDDSIFFELESDRAKKVNFFTMKSEAELEDDYLQLGQQENLEFFNVQNMREYEDKFGGSYINFYIRYDSQYNIYERKIYSIMDLLGDIGGLAESLYILGMLFVGFISHRLFISSILRRVYQVRRLDLF